MFERIQNQIQSWSNRTFNILIVSAICLIACLAYLEKLSATDAPAQRAPDESVDTYIPAGYALVPIEIANKQALGAMIGSFSIVDLYSTIEGHRGLKIAEQLKIIRAPLDPEQYAVLVPNQDSAKIVGAPGPLWVTIQNRSSAKQQVIKRVQAKSQIEVLESL